MSRDVEQILARLERVRPSVRRDREWWACCPVHDDRDPSLKVRAGDRRVFLDCQAGCTPEDVLAAFGWPSFFYEDDGSPAPPTDWRVGAHAAMRKLLAGESPGKVEFQVAPASSDPMWGERR